MQALSWLLKKSELLNPQSDTIIHTADQMSNSKETIFPRTTSFHTESCGLETSTYFEKTMSSLVDRYIFSVSRSSSTRTKSHKFTFICAARRFFQNVTLTFFFLLTLAN